MRRRSLLPLLAAAPRAATAQTRSFAVIFRDNYRKHWRDDRDYTLEVLEAMPSGEFEFRPHPAQRTFGDQLRHLAYANCVYFNVFKLVPIPSPPLATNAKELDAAADPADKESVRRFVSASFDYCASVLEKLTEEHLLSGGLQLRQPHTGIDVLLRAYMHTAHHRGQAVVYLRARGIAPPAWKFEPA